MREKRSKVLVCARYFKYISGQFDETKSTFETSLADMCMLYWEDAIYLKISPILNMMGEKKIFVRNDSWWKRRFYHKQSNEIAEFEVACAERD